jgi:hypothetical protein
LQRFPGDELKGGQHCAGVLKQGEPGDLEGDEVRFSHQG